MQVVDPVFYMHMFSLFYNNVYYLFNQKNIYIPNFDTKFEIFVETEELNPLFLRHIVGIVEGFLQKLRAVILLRLWISDLILIKAHEN